MEEANPDSNEIRPEESRANNFVTEADKTSGRLELWLLGDRKVSKSRRRPLNSKARIEKNQGAKKLSNPVFAPVSRTQKLAAKYQKSQQVQAEMKNHVIHEQSRESGGSSIMVSHSASVKPKGSYWNRSRLNKLPVTKSQEP